MFFYNWSRENELGMARPSATTKNILATKKKNEQKEDKKNSEFRR